MFYSTAKTQGSFQLDGGKIWSLTYYIRVQDNNTYDLACSATYQQHTLDELLHFKLLSILYLPSVY